MLLLAGGKSTAFETVSSDFQTNVFALLLGATKADLSLSSRRKRWYQWLPSLFPISRRRLMKAPILRKKPVS